MDKKDLQEIKDTVRVAVGSAAQEAVKRSFDTFLNTAFAPLQKDVQRINDTLQDHAETLGGISASVSKMGNCAANEQEILDLKVDVNKINGKLWGAVITACMAFLGLVVWGIKNGYEWIRASLERSY